MHIESLTKVTATSIGKYLISFSLSFLAFLFSFLLLVFAFLLAFLPLFTFATLK